METQTIENIRDQVEAIRNALRTFVAKQHEGEKFGSEQEYTATSLKAGLVALLNDLTGLTGEPSEFVRLSTYGERNEIEKLLDLIYNQLIQKDYASVVGSFDELKTKVRPYRARTSSESEEILLERADMMNNRCAELEGALSEVEGIQARAQKAEERTQSAEEKIASLDEDIHQVSEKSDEMNALYEKSQANEQQITELLTNAESKKGAIDLHAERIGEREGQLEEQEQKTDQYNTHLAEYKEQHERIQGTLETVLADARKALSNAAAVGISGAIHERYEEEKKRGRKNLWWVVLSAASAGIAGAIGYFTIIEADVEPKDITLGFVAARIVIVSVAISAAWFCASQYVRYRNTLDDYGYKSVLARSIIAFLDLFEDAGEREHYLKTVLGQIHQDPLRKSHDVDVPSRHIFNKFKKRKDQDNSVPQDIVGDE